MSHMEYRCVMIRCNEKGWGCLQQEIDIDSNKYQIHNMHEQLLIAE